MACVEVLPGGGLQSRVCARVGLLGNPSDGFRGAVLGFSLANFAAEVTLTPAATLRLVPNPVHDAQHFESLEALAACTRSYGYYGGLRILQAMCAVFWEHCQREGMQLSPSAGPFELSYSTSIPRQCGLSGSSALAAAALNCLLRWHGVEWAVPPAARPALVLAAEQQLGIAAGLQDRVVQVYGGLLLMDFSPSLGSQGRYTRLDAASLPPLYVIHAAAPPARGKDSGAVHASVRQLWDAGDAEVRETMGQIAALAEQGQRALLAGDLEQLAALMRRNLRLRRQLYSDAVVGAASLAMAELAESVGAAAKLTGSGGAVVALCPRGEQQEAALRAACEARGLACVRAELGPPLHPLSDGAAAGSSAGESAV